MTATKPATKKSRSRKPAATKAPAKKVEPDEGEIRAAQAEARATRKAAIAEGEILRGRISAVSAPVLGVPNAPELWDGLSDELFDLARRCNQVSKDLGADYRTIVTGKAKK